MRCPIILSRIGALPETALTDGAPAAPATGWLVPPGNATALADAIAAALQLSDEDRRAMGERARAFVTGRFTTVNLQRETLAVYDGLLGTALAERLVSPSPRPRDGQQDLPRH